MDEKTLIKSNERVKAHGEVFTPKKIVNLMLNQEGILVKTKSISATFLEPAAGEGAFLTEILKRKLKQARKISSSIEEYEDNALISLSSLYGIELLIDNNEILVMNMYRTFYRDYLNALQMYNSREKKNVIKSAMVIISANMAQGNALTGLNKGGDPIVFSEWKILPKKAKRVWVQRTEYTFDSIKNDGEPIEQSNQISGEMDLFAESGEFDDSSQSVGETLLSFVPCEIVRVYAEKQA